ncbi:MAG: putative metalloendopeptidase [Phormidesmis priestleyi Ana]|uniref:Putative metalloendopeptidase n=1 Tax=Phormidesmis priestleyi Ana TaxID=1666911 RepID=A0A0P7ZS16_9CYAN|nr:MAG: putative metalloendopeptidase [Phormidesmis priestleyi Ana]
MKQQRLLLLCLACLLFFCFAPDAISADLSAVETISFGQMPPFEQSGSWPSVGDLAADIGYETARDWVAGDYPVDVLKVGDILDGLHPEAFKLSDLASLEALLIADVPLIANLPLASLLQAVPFSGDWPLERLPGVAEALTQTLGLISEPDETLNQIISKQAGLGEQLTGDIFGELPLMTVPNIEFAQISDFEGFQEQSISSIPGLKDVALGDFPDPLSLLNFTAQQDIAFGPKEYSGDKPTPKPVSGSIEAGFQVPCIGGCPHIELAGPGWQGDQWMTKDHRVADGHGLLGAIPGMDEAGAYRLPFGKAFALQIRSTDEKTGAAEWGLAFRVCASGFFVDLGCTAYALEVPLGITTYEKDTILTGIKDGMGGRSQPVRAPPEWENLRPDTPPEVQSAIGRSRSGRRRGGFGLCGEGPGGINFQALSEAYGYIEGDYSSVGSYVDLGGNEKGYGLGKYQYMSYRADVRQIIQAKPGGAAFLKRADIGAAISSAELEQFFTPADQDSLFKADQTRNIEQAISEGFTGSRIVERIGQIHYGGAAAPIDGNWADVHGRLTLKTYGEELAENYHKVNSASEAKCKEGGLIAGKSIEEAIAYEQAGFQDFDAYRAYRGGYHAGIDFDYRFGAGEGGEVVALVGGEVTSIYPIAKNRVTGEDSMSVVLKSTDSEGREITQIYTHLSNSSVLNAVQVGESIGSGQSLGAVGGEDTVSRGAHLDYKVKVNGVYVDPDEFMQAVIDGGGTLTTINVRTGAKGTTQIGAIQ